MSKNLTRIRGQVVRPPQVLFQNNNIVYYDRKAWTLIDPPSDAILEIRYGCYSGRAAHENCDIFCYCFMANQAKESYLNNRKRGFSNTAPRRYCLFCEKEGSLKDYVIKNVVIRKQAETEKTQYFMTITRTTNFISFHDFDFHRQQMTPR